MEPNKSSTDRNPRITYSENSATRDGPSTNNGGQWQETRRDPRRDHGKKRERSRDLERSDRSFHGKRGNFWEESRERFNEEPPQQLPQQPTPYSFPFNSDHTYMTNNRHALSMPNYNLIAMNSQWGVNPMEGMAMPANMPVNPSPTAMPGTSGMEISQTTNGGMNPYAYMGMPGGNMFGMMGNYCQFGVMNSQENMVGPAKEVIQLTQCVLYPPNPKAPPPITRNKSLGCKTVFVGGLPEKATEEIVKEVFERCGDILKIRMSKKNICHIRFASEAFVENALYFSGYEMRVENKTDLPYVGNLHVDYALTRDDQIECQQQTLGVESNHLQLEEGYFKASTPPPVVHYSEDEATRLKEKLRDDETFQQALMILISWLEKGECNKRNCNSFYSMIQSTNSHVRRLMNEKLKYEDDLNKAKSMLMKQIQETLNQFKEIEKVFSTASLQKVWDHFTKAQRRNIDLWKKQTEETKRAHLAELLNDRIEDEMELSEDEEKESTIVKTSDISEQQKNMLKEELNKLKEDNDALRCQLEAAENEKMVLRSETARELDLKERQIQLLEHASQNASKQLLNKRSVQFNEVHASKPRRSIDNDDNQDGNNEHSDLNPVGSSSSVTGVGESKAILICLVSTFLHVHPFGASIDYICSYLHQYDNTIDLRDVENLMKCYPTVFREDSTGIGASLGKKWRFLGFQC